MRRAVNNRMEPNSEERISWFPAPRESELRENLAPRWF